MSRLLLWNVMRVLGIALLAVLMTASPAMAQDDDDDDADQLGTFLHQGACDSMGEVVKEIESIEDSANDDDQDDDRGGDDEVWDRIGGEDSQPDQWWAGDDDIDLQLQDALDGEYVIAVYEGEEPDSGAIVCGAITGEPDEDGGLLIDLKETEDSGYEGRAYLIPDDASDDDDDDDDDDDGTEILLGIWEVQPAGV